MYLTAPNNMGKRGAFMGDIIIKLLDRSFEENLFKFELENRLYFEKIGFPRADSYYDYNNFKIILKELIEEQKRGLIYMYLIIDNTANIVGRVNLVSIVKGSLNKAELGYRVGENHQRKGYGTKGVELVLDEAFKKHKLHRIEAGTSPDNIGSQIILIKNGFQFVGRQNEYIYHNGKWHDSIIFEKIL